jgi:hypothetical protein
MVLNKNILFVVSLLFLCTSLFAQQLKDVIVVDIPLNCSKTVAVEKLKQKEFELRERKEDNGIKSLRYVRGGGYYGPNAMVILTEENKKITRTCWGCSNIDAIQLELEEEFDLSPYYSISEEQSEILFYHWKGKTIMLEHMDESFISSLQQAVGLIGAFGDYGLVNGNDVNDVKDMMRFPHSITILSNEDAGRMVQQHKNQIMQRELEEMEKEQQQRQRIERQKEAAEQQKRIHDSIQRENQRRQDSIRQENQRKESLRQERNKELLQVCKFLFDSNEEYESCVVKKNDIAEQDIKGRVVKKLQYIYPLVLNGKELRKEKQPGRNELIQICNMCAQLKNVKSQCDNEEIEIISHICDYAESKLGDFVSGRSALNKAYKKTSNKSYSSFLLSYMNDK